MKLLVLPWCNCKCKKLKNGEIKESTFSSDIIRPLIVRQKKAPDQGWQDRLKIDNRYRYSLLFRHRMQKFSTFFHYRLGLFPTFLRGKSVLIN